MNEQTKETIRAIAEALRYGAEKRLALSPHSNSAHTMHDIANELSIAVSLDGTEDR